MKYRENSPRFRMIYGRKPEISDAGAKWGGKIVGGGGEARAEASRVFPASGAMKYLM